jgi:hypothetical protein
LSWAELEEGQAQKIRKHVGQIAMALSLYECGRHSCKRKIRYKTASDRARPEKREWQRERQRERQREEENTA